MSKLGKKGIKKEEILELYDKGLNTAQIAEQLGCDKSNISHRLKRIGICFKLDYSKVRRSRINRYEVDTDFFENIDTEAKAYFLGLMYSDGSVTRNQFYIKLKDEDILQKFKKELQTEAPIRRIEKPYSMYILEVSCKKLCDQLISHGCVPNKTRVLRLPKLEKN